MRYDFKPLAEFGWFIAAAAAPPVLQALTTFDPDKIADWRVWSISLGAAAVRAIAGAALAWLGKRAAGGQS